MVQRSSSSLAARTLAWIFGVGGVTAVAIGLLHVTLGTASIPGGQPVNPTMDGEDRFYAVIFAGYGAALIWASRDMASRHRAASLLIGLFFVAGLARALSWALRGPPHPFFVAMTGLELALPILVWALLAAMRRSASQPA